MITVDNLSKSFDGRAVLDGVLLGLPDGMITAVVGGPASGKSTLARVIGRQCRADGGTVLTSGGVLPRVGMLTSSPDLIMHRTVLGNVSLPLERAGADRARRMKITARLLDLVGLPDRAACLPDRLSPGERARVSLARALACGPTLLICDDPTAALPAEGAAGLLSALDRVRAELGITVLLLTSDGQLAARIADHVALLHQGRITATAYLYEAVADPDSPVAEAILPPLGDAEPATLAQHERVADVVLIGHAALSTLADLTSGGGAEVTRIAGAVTRFGETPVAHYRLGISGPLTDTVLTVLTRCATTLRDLTPVTTLAAA